MLHVIYISIALLIIIYLLTGFLSRKSSLHKKFSFFSISFIGILCIISANYLSSSIDNKPGDIYFIYSSSLSSLGISIVLFSLISILMDMDSWKDYFIERLKSILMDHEYLKSLDEKTLKTVQTNVLKAQFKNNNIDNEGSFLEYFHKHLHKYISTPYRQDVHATLIMEKDLISGNIKVKDKVTYKCRAISGIIQENIRWIPDEDEFVSVESLEIYIKIPENHKNCGKEILIANSNKKIKPEKLKEFISNKNIELTEESYTEEKFDLKRNGLDIPIAEVSEIDNLIVTTISQYVISEGNFQYWQMSHPTKNFTITISYPKDQKIQFKTLVIDDWGGDITNEDGFLSFKYNHWALPQSGLAWLVHSPSKNQEN